jgi:hypothetical protein
VSDGTAAAIAVKAFDKNDVQVERKYGQAYVPFVHHVERLYEAATAAAHDSAASRAHAEELVRRNHRHGCPTPFTARSMSRQVLYGIVRAILREMRSNIACFIASDNPRKRGVRASICRCSRR